MGHRKRTKKIVIEIEICVPHGEIRTLKSRSERLDYLDWLVCIVQFPVHHSSPSLPLGKIL